MHIDEDEIITLPVGTLLQNGRYRIVRFISSGGFGCTYEAEHTRLKIRVAIKELFVKDFCNRDSDSKTVTLGIRSRQKLLNKLEKKFGEEAHALSLMNYPGIVRVTDIFNENDTTYYVMDYVDGNSLAQIIKSSGPMDENVARRMIVQVAHALKYVHSKNRLHLDVKPGNIMVDRHGKTTLIDFGASKQYDEEDGENTSTLLSRTPGYAPIEQMGENLINFTPSTDIYSLGATFYTLLTGKAPTSATLRVSGEPLAKLPDNVSKSSRDAIKAAMSINRLKRPQTIDEFLELLDVKHDDNLLVDQTVVDKIPKSKVPKPTVQQPTNQPEPQPPVEPGATEDDDYNTNSKTRLFIIVAVALVVSVAAAFFIFGNKTDEASDSVTTLKYDPISHTITYGDYSYNLVHVEGGTFIMGEGGENIVNRKENPIIPHEVTLSSYYIGATEVPQWLWCAVMTDNPSKFKGPTLPVESVSWDECKDFIVKLNIQLNCNFTLPTEAQWEFAALGGNKSAKCNYSGTNQLDSVAWYKDNSKNTSHPVGEKAPNELGLYDMSGNVYEWCNDIWGDYTNKADIDPTGPSKGRKRVRRGGSWNLSPKQCLTIVRGNQAHNTKADFVGFRLAAM